MTEATLTCPSCGAKTIEKVGDNCVECGKLYSGQCPECGAKAGKGGVVNLHKKGCAMKEDKAINNKVVAIKEETKVIEQCSTCKCYIRDHNTGMSFCRRFPKYEHRGATEWCYEWRGK